MFVCTSKTLATLGSGSYVIRRIQYHLISAYVDNITAARLPWKAQHCQENDSNTKYVHRPIPRNATNFDEAKQLVQQYLVEFQKYLTLCGKEAGGVCTKLTQRGLAVEVSFKEVSQRWSLVAVYAFSVARCHLNRK